MANESLVHVIDDDGAVRDSLAFLLASARLDVRTYESATEFLAQIGNLTGGCIVTDVRMPDISGIDMLRRLRQQGITIPVIVIVLLFQRRIVAGLTSGAVKG